MKYADAILNIKDLIRFGSYAKGQKLPTKLELTQMLDTSRITIERALAELTKAKIISSRRGSGIYVNKVPPGSREIFLLAFSNRVLLKEVGHERYHGIMSYAEKHNIKLQEISWDDFKNMLINKKAPEKLLVPGEQLKYLEPELKKMLIKKKTQVVQYGSKRALPEYKALWADQETGMYKAVVYLASLGHKKIAYVDHFDVAVISKFRGFLKGLEDSLIPFEPSRVYKITAGIDREKKVIEQVDLIIDMIMRDSAISAILFGRDFLANAAIKYLTEKKIPVPERLSIMGYNNNKKDCLAVEPNLTTVDPFAGRQGADALKLLFCTYHDSEKTVVKIEPEIKVRNSVGSACN